MKVESISLCDECKERVKTTECDLCHKDLCKECNYRATAFDGLITYDMCQSCRANLAKAVGGYSNSKMQGENIKPFIERENLKEKLIDYLRGLVTLKKL